MPIPVVDGPIKRNMVVLPDIKSKVNYDSLISSATSLYKYMKNIRRQDLEKFRNMLDVKSVDMVLQNSMNKQNDLLTGYVDKYAKLAKNQDYKFTGPDLLKMKMDQRELVRKQEEIKMQDEVYKQQKLAFVKAPNLFDFQSTMKKFEDYENGIGFPATGTFLKLNTLDTQKFWSDVTKKENITQGSKSEVETVDPKTGRIKKSIVYRTKGLITDQEKWDRFNEECDKKPYLDYSYQERFDDAIKEGKIDPNDYPGGAREFGFNQDKEIIGSNKTEYSEKASSAEKGSKKKYIENDGSGWWSFDWNPVAVTGVKNPDDNSIYKEVKIVGAGSPESVLPSDIVDQLDNQGIYQVVRIIAPVQAANRDKFLQDFAESNNYSADQLNLLMMMNPPSSSADPIKAREFYLPYDDFKDAIKGKGITLGEWPDINEETKDE